MKHTQQEQELFRILEIEFIQNAPTKELISKAAELRSARLKISLEEAIQQINNEVGYG